jgi:tetratricopeptide (TPR) repeat protein
MSEPAQKEVKDLIKDLLKSVGEPEQRSWGRAVFWIGAGCSRSAGIPLAGEIAQQCVIKLANKYSLGKMDTKDPLKALNWLHENERVNKNWYLDGKPKWGQLYGHIFEEELKSINEQREIILGSISQGEDKINWAHLCLGELVKRGYIHTVLTTNFDQLVLEGIIRTGILPVIADGIESLNRIDSVPKTPQVVHLHGSMHTYNMRNSTADVRETQQLALESMLHKLLRDCDLLVVIGYAGGEEGVMRVLLEVTESLPNLVIYWIMHEGNPDSLSEEAGKLLGLGHNKFFIPNSDADTLFAQVMEELGIGIPEWMDNPTTNLVGQSKKFASSENDDIEIKIKRYQEKVQELSRQWTATPVQSSDLLDKIATLRLEGNHEEALDELRKMEGTENPEVWRMRADSAYELGQLPLDDELLKESITAWRHVLGAIKRVEAPDRWYDVQRGLGSALLALSESNETDVESLKAAISGLRVALEIRKHPPEDWNERLDWADVQDKLGSACLKLGELEENTKYVKEAVKAHRAALQVYTRDKAPDKWAETQAHLGAVLRTLGERERDTVLLDEAVAAYREALRIKTHKSSPLEWAELQDNLGGVLQTQGMLNSAISILEDAVEAYQEALKVYPQGDKRAATQFNLGESLQDAYKLKDDVSFLERAATAYHLALEFYQESGDKDSVRLVEEELGKVRKILEERKEELEE